MTISDEKLDELQALCDAASPQPWMTTSEPPYGIASTLTPQISLLMIDRDGMAYVDLDKNAKFIVAACNALPELLAEVRRLRTAGDALMIAATALLHDGPDMTSNSIVRLRAARASIDEWNKLALASARKEI